MNPVNRNISFKIRNNQWGLITGSNIILFNVVFHIRRSVRKPIVDGVAIRVEEQLGKLFRWGE